jgi:cystathionine beta-lyase/cystathionine gamma-synthase
MGFLQNAMGAALSPQDAWLVLRGLKTLALRLERQQHNALVLARWLRRQPGVLRVAYPGLLDDPNHVVLARSAGGKDRTEFIWSVCRLRNPAKNSAGTAESPAH